MHSYVLEIAREFQTYPENSYLTINEVAGRYEFSTSKEINKSSAQTTIIAFKKIFHDSAFIYPPHFLPIRKHIRKIFIQYVCFNEKGNPFECKSYEELAPIFLGKQPSLHDFKVDKAKTSGKGFKGLAESVFLQWHHFFQTQKCVEVDPKKKEIREAEFLTSRMADREFRKGSYLFLNRENLYQVDEVICGGGAYISLLKDINEPFKVKIICRGTALRKTATEALASGRNDLQKEIGIEGVHTVWPYLFKYLKDTQIKEVEVLGKSLGGAHAQLLTLLIMKEAICKVISLTTVCSVGVGREAEAFFYKCMTQNPCLSSLKVRVIRNGGSEKDIPDAIPLVGGRHLGATIPKEYLDCEVIYVHPTSQSITRPNLNRHAIRRGYHFLSSFKEAHVRQSTLEDFNYELITSREEVHKELLLGESLEPYRQMITYKPAASLRALIEESRVSSTKNTTLKTIHVSILFFFACSIGLCVCAPLQMGKVIYISQGYSWTLPTLIFMFGTLLSYTIASLSWIFEL